MISSSCRAMLVFIIFHMWIIEYELVSWLLEHNLVKSSKGSMIFNTKSRTAHSAEVGSKFEYDLCSLISHHGPRNFLTRLARTSMSRVEFQRVETSPSKTTGVRPVFPCKRIKCSLRCVLGRIILDNARIYLFISQC